MKNLLLCYFSKGDPGEEAVGGIFLGFQSGLWVVDAKCFSLWLLLLDQMTDETVHLEDVAKPKVTSFCSWVDDNSFCCSWVKLFLNFFFRNAQSCLQRKKMKSASDKF